MKFANLKFEHQFRSSSYVAYNGMIQSEPFFFTGGSFYHG